MSSIKIISNVVLLQTISEQESTVSPPNQWVLHPQIQPTVDGKCLKKKKNSRKFQNTKLEFSIPWQYIAFTTIYIEFTLY